MKPRIKRISGLWHRWGHKIQLDSVDCAQALAEAGAIELISTDRYREIENTELTAELYNNLIMDILKDHKARIKGYV